jgi:8-oxo-dGTP diphosphatase
LSDRLYPDRPFLAVSVAVFRDGKVLIAERMKAPMKGVFTLPGGMVESGERLVAAAARELMEEVGITAEILSPLRPVEIIDRDLQKNTRFHAVVIPHAARYRAGEARPNDEIGQLMFVTPAELARYWTTPGLEAIVAEAEQIVKTGASIA